MNNLSEIINQVQNGQINQSSNESKNETKISTSSNTTSLSNRDSTMGDDEISPQISSNDTETHLNSVTKRRSRYQQHSHSSTLSTSNIPKKLDENSEKNAKNEPKIIQPAKDRGSSLVSTLRNATPSRKSSNEQNRPPEIKNIQNSTNKQNDSIKLSLNEYTTAKETPMSPSSLIGDLSNMSPIVKNASNENFKSKNLELRRLSQNESLEKLKQNSLSKETILVTPSLVRRLSQNPIANSTPNINVKKLSINKNEDILYDRLNHEIENLKSPKNSQIYEPEPDYWDAPFIENKSSQNNEIEISHKANLIKSNENLDVSSEKQSIKSDTQSKIIKRGISFERNQKAISLAEIIVKSISSNSNKSGNYSSINLF